ncbi:MAG TPA: hypothetical protein VMX97_14835, partial [Hyphomicrobiaceae bacterium]|nr:hypothetical protein [Hyphomicrobiaceae bacterium]
WDMFDILMTAVKRHGTLDVDLPPAPPPFRFADKSEAKSVLESSGFEAIDVHKHEALWVGANGNQLLELLYKGIVRAPMLIEAQAPKARALIKEQIRSNAEAMSVDGEIRMRWPFLIVRAAKK